MTELRPRHRHRRRKDGDQGRRLSTLRGPGFDALSVAKSILIGDLTTPGQEEAGDRMIADLGSEIEKCAL
jgi:hypothetical protein